MPQGLDNSSVLACKLASTCVTSHKFCLKMPLVATGVELQNSGCSAVCSNSTFHVAEDAALNASGRLSSGLLSLAACPKEQVRLSGIHLHSWSSALLSTRPSSVVVDQVSVEYKPPVNNLQVLAAKDGFRAVSVGHYQISRPISCYILVVSSLRPSANATIMLIMQLQVYSFVLFCDYKAQS